ncbi:MAG: hypothetical protein WCP57_10915 [Bacteroidota bacterium]
MGLDAFEKFINPKPKNGVIREQIKREKKAAKKEKREFFEKKKEEKKAASIFKKIY